MTGHPWLSFRQETLAQAKSSKAGQAVYKCRLEGREMGGSNFSVPATHGKHLKQGRRPLRPSSCPAANDAARVAPAGEAAGAGAGEGQREPISRLFASQPNPDLAISISSVHSERRGFGHLAETPLSFGPTYN